MSSKELKAIGKRIKLRIVELETTQTALAAKLGYKGRHRQTVSAWATGRTPVPTLMLCRLCAALECSVAWLLTGRGSQQCHSHTHSKP
jgi:transcriptional regulator with XRE-family HTH domain